MKKVFFTLTIISLSLFIASCASTPKETPEPPLQEETFTQGQEQNVPETINCPEPEISLEQPPAEETPVVPEENVIQSQIEIPLPEEKEIFDEPEMEENFLTEEYNEYEEYEEETQDELFEVSEEEELILSQEPEPEPEEEQISEPEPEPDEPAAPVIPEGFTAEENREELSVKENVNLEELNALTENQIEETSPQEEQSPEESEEDYSEEDYGMIDDYEVEEVFEEEYIPSRTMQLLKNQFVDVVYPGSGWVYLGETDDTEIFRYQGRKAETSRTVFTLKSIRSGTAILHFYKNDILTGKYIDDYLEITVDDEKTSDINHITAPSYEEIVPERLLSVPEEKDTLEEGIEKESESETVNNPSKKSSPNKNSTTSSEKKSTEYKPFSGKPETAEGQTNIQKTTSEKTGKPVTSEDSSKISHTETVEQSPASSEKYSDLTSDELLSKAKNAFKEKRYSETLDYLDSFFDKAVTHVDEALYLKGQTLETKSAVRNIKAALEAYEDLVKKYPQSSLWSKSNDRITYLKRFYFNIR